MYKKNKKFLNYLLLFIFTIIVLYFSLKDNFIEVINVIITMDIKYLFIAFMLIFLFWIFRSYPMYSFCKKINKKFKYKNSILLTLRTQFFNAVTPFATGGQPYQIYYLNQCDIDVAASTSIVIENFIVYQIALVVLGIIALVENNVFHIFSKNYLLQKLIALGFLINTVVIVVMFLVAFNKKMNKKLVNFGINLLTKLKIVKDKQAKLKEWDLAINRFHKSAKKLLSDKKTFILNIFYNFLALICLYLIPYFIICSVGLNDSISTNTTIITSAYVMIIGSFVPIPGATGGLEYGFMAFYSNFIGGSKLNAVMLVWRFITYYFGIIMGSLALNIKRRK